MDSARSYAFLLARATLIVATAYLVLAQTGFTAVPPWTVALIVFGLVTCAAAFKVPRVWFESPAVTAGLLVVDTAWITALLLSVGSFDSEFFYLYFFVLFLAAIGERLGLIALGAVVVCAAYLYVTARTGQGGALALDTPTLIRVPFLFTVATFYGYLVDRVRRERQRARIEAASVRRLKEVRRNLEAANRELKREARERRQAELSLREANMELARLSELKSSFVSIVSHELRTPLTSIKNAVGLVHSERAGNLQPEQVRFLDMASRNLDRLALIIDDLLDLSKIEAGRIEYRFRPLAVTDLVAEAHATFAPQAVASEVELLWEAEDGLAPIWGDPNRLSQVLSNLVGNALKFTNAGGRVTLAARRESGTLVLEVADTGVGIEADELDRIFEPFHQAEDCLTRSIRGTGLGLSVARELVWAHGGELTVSSTPGEGSRFTVRLPAVLGEAKELAEAEEALRRLRKLPVSGVLAVTWDGEEAPACLTGEGCRRSVLLAVRDLLRESLPKASDLLLVQPAHNRLVVVLPNTPRAGAVTVRDRLARRLAKCPIQIDGAPVPPPRILGPGMVPEDGSTARVLLAAVMEPEEEGRTSVDPGPRDRSFSRGERGDDRPNGEEGPGGGRRAGRGGDGKVPAVPGGLRRRDGEERHRGAGYGALLSA